MTPSSDPDALVDDELVEAMAAVYHDRIRRTGAEAGPTSQDSAGPSSFVVAWTGAASPGAASAVAPSTGTGSVVPSSIAVACPSRARMAGYVPHTVQQGAAAPRAQFKLEVSQPGDVHETEADRAADVMVQG